MLAIGEVNGDAGCVVTGLYYYRTIYILGLQSVRCFRKMIVACNNRANVFSCFLFTKELTATMSSVFDVDNENIFKEIPFKLLLVN